MFFSQWFWAQSPREEVVVLDRCLYQVQQIESSERKLGGGRVREPKASCRSPTITKNRKPRGTNNNKRKTPRPTKPTGVPLPKSDKTPNKKHKKQKKRAQLLLESHMLCLEPQVE